MAAWRQAHPGQSFDLVGADLGGARLSGIDLSGADLSDAVLAGADLRKARLCDARLVNTNLADVLAGGADFSRADLSRAVMGNADFDDAILVEVDLRESHLARARLRGADLRGARLDRAYLAGAILTDAKMQGADLREVRAPTADFTGANIERATLYGADLTGALLLRTSLHGARTRIRARDGGEQPPGEDRMVVLLEARLKGADLRGTDFAGMDFTGMDLSDVRADGANLSRTLFADANLSGAKFDDADLTNANLEGARVDADTSFRGAVVEGTRVDRHTLESLHQYGGLTPGDRVRMEILDGVVTLRAHYSGFWQYIHLTALVLFVFPYVWFVLTRLTTAGVGIPSLAGFFPNVGGEPPPTITLWEALLRYIWNGGVKWQAGWLLDPLAFGSFCFSFLYNLLRFVLLWKTKDLELRQEASGLPVRFSLTGLWGRLYFIANVGFFINILVVLHHTYHFMQQRIPLR